MLDTFIFGDLNSIEYNAYITGAGVFETPAKQYTKIPIEGRNGDLILESKYPTFDNVSVRYPAVIVKNFKKSYEALKSALSSNLSYAVLSDTIEPERFRLGTFKEITSLKMTNHLDAGTFEIVFDCKPQWFLEEGNIPISVNGNMSLFNPTSHYAKPLIKATGNGVIGLNEQVITIINNAGKTLYIDSEAEDAYSGVENRNGDITLSNGEFPMLKPNQNALTLTGAITLEIIPRWFEI